MRFRISSLNLIIILAFALLFQLMLISSLFGAVEITIEYNVTQNCTGSVVLTISPSTVGKGGSITPSATGLATCGGFNIYFRNASCSGATVSQCTVPSNDGGCTGTSFSAPNSPGSFTYIACIDKNSNSAYTEAGETNSKVLTVTSGVPSVGSLTFNPNPVDLIEEGVKTASVSATITDSDGATDISSCRGYLWNSTTAPPRTIGNARYTNSSCSLTGCSGTTCSCTCAFGLMYYDVNGTWYGNITAIGKSGSSNTNGGSFFVNSKIAISVSNIEGPISSTNYPIQFTSLSVGDTNKPSSSNPLKIKNTGNVKIKLMIYGSDHVGVSDPSWVIKVGNMTYNSSATGMGSVRQLTSISTDFYPNGGIPNYPNLISGISEPATFYVYNYLTIPTGMKAQTYSGTYYLDMEIA